MLESLLWIAGGACFVSFVFVIAYGAPFLPTLSPQIREALDLIDLQPGQTLLELGSGDGRVLIAAAERGWRAIGYELNPLLAFYSWLRTRRYNGRVKVVWGNFWKKKLPPAEGVFVFLLNPYMARLDKKVVQELGRNVKLVSFAFQIPGRKPVRQAKGLFLYTY